MKNNKKKNKDRSRPIQPIPGSNSTSNFNKQKKFILIALFIYAITLYINTSGHGYAFDDSVVITGNQYTKMGFRGIPLLLQKDMFEGIYNKALELGGGRYRPLSLVTFAIEYQFFGENPHLSHCVNILLYGITAMLLFLTLLKLLKNSILPAALTTLLFIAHPIHTEVVANIKSRDEILAFLFLIISCYYLVQYVYNRRVMEISISIACFFLSLLSKENGITFIILFPLMLYYFTGKNIKEAIRVCIPFYATGIVYIAIRTILVGSIGDKINSDIMENPFVQADLSERVGTILYILARYIWLMIFPHPLSSDYSFNEIPLISIVNPKSLLSMLLLGLFLFYSIKNYQKKDILSFSFILFLLPLLLVSNLFFNIGAPMAERFLYLPSLGFCLAISILILKFFKTHQAHNLLQKNIALNLFMVMLLCGFSWKTVQRNKDWKNNETLFGQDAKSAPNSAKIHYYYGNTLLTDLLKSKEGLSPERLNKLTVAKQHTLSAVRINPLFHHAHYNLGLIYQELQMADSALYHLNAVLKIQPTHILTQSALGSVYGKMKGDFDKAIYYLEIAAKYDADNRSVWENLGIAYAEKKMFEKSIAAFTRSLEISPNNAQTYLNIAITYQNMGEVKKAEEFFNKAFQLDPSLKK